MDRGTALEFRRAKHADFAAMVDIQRPNLRQNLDEQDARFGFLSVEFSREDFATIHAQLGIYVAESGAGLAGYAVADTLPHAANIPLIAHMISRFPQLRWQELPLAEQRLFIYGPVCVSQGARGLGVLPGMVRCMAKDLQHRFDLGVGFVGKTNRHSYAAHVERIGMAVIDEFGVGGREFWTIAFAPRALAGR